MNNTAPSIIFPHLGIRIPEFSSSFSIFGLQIAWYGVLIAIGIFLAILLSLYRAKKTGQKPDDYYDLAIIGVISAIVGARLYYVLFNLEYYLAQPIEIFHIRNGGLAIYGGIIGGFLAGWITCRVKKIPFFRVLDTVAPAIALGQAIGRWGNFFNREAFGDYTDSLFAMQIRLSDVGGILNDSIRDHLISIDGTSYIQAHPTFLYESVWCLLLCILICIFTRYKRYDGETILWYLGGYGLERMIVEGLRTDSLMIADTGIRVSQVLSGILFIGSVILLIRNRIHKKKNPE